MRSLARAACRGAEGGCRRDPRRHPRGAHAEGVADEGAEVASIGDAAVFRPEGPEQRRPDLLLQAVAILESQSGGGNRREDLDDDAAAEDGEVAVRGHYVRGVVEGDRYHGDLLLD